MLRVILIIVFFLFGCAEDKTFKKIEDRSEIGKLHSFSIMASNNNLLYLAKKAAKNTNITISNSPYTIIVESSKYPQHCNNPLTPAYEATYDGYVKITIKKTFKKIYFIQRDFHDDIDEDILEDLFEIMKKDMKIN